jgi:hypothetical protein
MPQIEFIPGPLLGPLLVLTPGSKEVLEAIRQAMEAYYLIKYLELEATNPWKGKPIPPPGPEQSNVGSREGYTPDPDDPDPVPWPFPWWHRSNLSILESIVNGKSGQIGAALGDPYPQTNSFDVIKSNAFHLEAATAALEKMELARGQLIENIARLQKQEQK